MTSIHFLDTHVRVHIGGEQTGGGYALAELRAPAGHMPPPHVHAREGEGFLVLEGELTVHTAAGSVALGPGGSAHSPAGEAHTIEVTSPGPARWLVVSAPAGFEAFVRAFGVETDSDDLPVLDGPPDADRLVAVAAEHGITFVGPPGSRPADLVGAPAAG